MRRDGYEAVKSSFLLTLQKCDGQLVRVEILEIVSQVVVEEPGGPTLQHGESVNARWGQMGTEILLVKHFGHKNIWASLDSRSNHVQAAFIFISSSLFFIFCFVTVTRND